MKFLLVPDDREFPTHHEAAAALRPKWDRLQLRNALALMQPGDELEISSDQSLIALSGNCKEFKS